jgi:hypothetical protein
VAPCRGLLGCCDPDEIRFRLTLAPGVRVDYKVQPTLRLRSPLSVCLHRQDGAVAASSLEGSITQLVRFLQ